MARKIPSRRKAPSRRPVIGGIALACIVALGLAVLLVLGRDYDQERADIFTSVLIYLFNFPLIVEPDSYSEVLAVYLGLAFIGIASAVLAVLRREWTFAWFGSFTAIAFGPLALVPMWLIGSSDICFTRDSIMARIESWTRSPEGSRDPHAGFVAVMIVAILTSHGFVVMVIAITSSLLLSILLLVVALILTFTLVTAVSSALRRRRANADRV